MRVVIIGSAHPLRGGLAAYNERLARQFQSEGDEVVVYTFSLQYPSLLFPGKTQYADWPAPEDLDIRVRVNSINPLNWWSVGNEIRDMRPDLVVVKYWLPFMGPCFGTLAGRIRSNGHSRIVCILDNLIPHETRPGDVAFTRYFAKRVDAFVGMSDSVLEDLERLSPRQPSDFCPHPLFDNFGEKIGREEALEWLGLDPAYRYLLFFGFIRDYKGLDLLIEAMARPELQGRPLRALVAGEFYVDAKPYLDLIERRGVGDRLELRTDFIPDHEVNRYFGAADLVVQPYKSATQSGVTQIGYHFEKPMLVTNVGGLPEIIPHGQAGYVVEPDPAEIATAIADFYDAHREAAFSAFAAREKEKYSWNRMTQTIRGLLQRIDGGPHAHS